jgi:hypothetical protein
MTMSVSDRLRRMGMIRMVIVVGTMDRLHGLRAGMVLLLAALGAGILSLYFLLAVHQCPPVTGLP